MNCFGCERNLSSYLDDELSVEERLEIEAHLEDCEGCRAEFEAHQSAWEVAGGLQAGAAPDGLWRGVEANLEEEGSSGSLEDLALMIKGLASEIQDLRRSVDGLRRQVEQAEWGVEEREAEGYGRLPDEIRVGPGRFRAGTPREASIEQLRRSS